MNKASKKTGAAILSALFILAIAIWPVRTVIVEGESNRPLLLACDKGETITLEYVHSIYHVRQQEIYELVGSNLVLQTMFFGDISAALYYDSYLRYPLKPLAGGGYISNELNLEYPAVSFALGHGTQYSLKIGTQSVDLHEAFRDSTFLTIRTEVMPRGMFMLRRLVHGTG